MSIWKRKENVKLDSGCIRFKWRVKWLERLRLPRDDVCHMKSPFQSTFPSAKIIFIIPLWFFFPPLYGRDFRKIYSLSCDVEKEQSQQRGHKTGSIREGCKHPSLATELSSFFSDRSGFISCGWAHDDRCPDGTTTNMFDWWSNQMKR